VGAEQKKRPFFVRLMVSGKDEEQWRAKPCGILTVGEAFGTPWDIAGQQCGKTEGTTQGPGWGGTEGKDCKKT